jgi:heme/copper-type cytochrome/quinol oxidase subunit 1
MGVEGMPRRVFTYPNTGSLPELNLIATCGAYVMLAGVMLFALNVVISSVRAKPAGDDPWGAYSLEWATTSPPPEFNFTSLPPIRSERPVWDLHHPRAAEARR